MEHSLFLEKTFSILPAPLIDCADDAFKKQIYIHNEKAWT